MIRETQVRMGDTDYRLNNGAYEARCNFLGPDLADWIEIPAERVPAEVRTALNFKVSDVML